MVLNRRELYIGETYTWEETNGYYALLRTNNLRYGVICCFNRGWREFRDNTPNFRKAKHLGQEYLVINPKHKVPLLTAYGKKISENLAIVTWIDGQFPDSQPLPSNPWDRVRAYSIHGWCSGGIHPYLRQINNPAKVADVAEAADGIVANSAAAIYGSLLSQMKCLMAAIGSLTIPSPRIWISFGVIDAQNSLILILRGSILANHILTGYPRGLVSGRCWSLKNQYKQVLLPELAHASSVNVVFNGRI